MSAWERVATTPDDDEGSRLVVVQFAPLGAASSVGIDTEKRDGEGYRPDHDCYVRVHTPEQLDALVAGLQEARRRWVP